ncbi:PilZ domain-containing protein [Brevibacillus sp. TJ4]|uniref:PilZ domain-containing protein n=1 Tax=Brevibacillus sp. TJ4 TaxID=3234853 RepID=UPI003B9E20EB
MDRIIQIKKEKKTIEGTVIYEEGDLIEALFETAPEVVVGDQLPCLLTSDYETFVTFQGVVLARENNRLFFFYSPTVAEFREQRRRYPRFDMDLRGWLQYPAQEPTLFSINSLMVDLVNLSLGGMAFRCDRQVPSEAPLYFSAELYGRNRPDGVISGEIVIIHEQHKSPYFLYGCKFRGLTSRYLHNLRKYLLQRQLDERRQHCRDN